MKFGLREMLFFVVMVGLLASTYFFVFDKADKKRAALRQEIITKERALNDLRQSTTGIDAFVHQALASGSTHTYVYRTRDVFGQDSAGYSAAATATAF